MSSELFRRGSQIFFFLNLFFLQFLGSSEVLSYKDGDHTDLRADHPQSLATLWSPIPQRSSKTTSLSIDSTRPNSREESLPHRVGAKQRTY